MYRKYSNLIKYMATLPNNNTNPNPNKCLLSVLSTHNPIQ